MDIQVEKTSAILAKVSVTIPAATVDEAFSSVLREVNKNVQIDGFRQGKAPKELVESQYAQTIKREVKQHLVEKTLVKALSEKNLVPVAYPTIESAGGVNKGEAFSYTANVELHPEISLQLYKGLRIPRYEYEILDREVEFSLQNMQKEAAEVVPVMIRDVVQENDVVGLDYEALSPERHPFPNNKADNIFFTIGEDDNYLPGFSKGLVGEKVPSEKTIAVTFPENYEMADLAGKTLDFAVRLKELKTREYPKIDDEFAKDLGQETLAILKLKVTAEIKVYKDNIVNNKKRDAVVKELIVANPFAVPPSLIREQSSYMVARGIKRMETMYRTRLDFNEQQLQQFHKDAEKDAEIQVRGALLLMEIAKKENLSDTEAEVNAEIAKMLEQERPEKLEESRAFLSQPQQRQNIGHQIIERKVVDFLVAQAISTDVCEKVAEFREPEKPEIKQESRIVL